MATRERQEEGETAGKEEQRECGTKHRCLSQRHQDRLQPWAKFSPSRLPLPPGWLMNDPLTRSSVFALLPGHRFCSVSTGPARRAHSQQLNHNTRAAVGVKFHRKEMHPDCVKRHTKEVNHQGYSHCALLHIETTYWRISFLEIACCCAIDNINTWDTE